MLPGAKAIYDHPRVQADPMLKIIIETLSDVDKYQHMTPDQISLAFGYVLGVLHHAFRELDAWPPKP